MTTQLPGMLRNACGNAAAAAGNCPGAGRSKSRAAERWRMRGPKSNMPTPYMKPGGPSQPWAGGRLPRLGAASMRCLHPDTVRYLAQCASKRLRKGIQMVPPPLRSASTSEKLMVQRRRSKPLPPGHALTHGIQDFRRAIQRAEADRWFR